MSYSLTGKRDCLILSVEKYQNAGARSNAQADAIRLSQVRGQGMKCFKSDPKTGTV